MNQREVVVDGKKINDAANNLVRQSDDSLLPKENRYSKALQLSLGSWALGSEGSSHVPSPVDVARISGLSLPHLEVLNIVLSKRTAEEFLEMATGVNAAAMVKKYVRYTNYRERFLRPVAKVNRRLLFTFAEILSLIGYSGPATS
ncbi:hypothetical protein F183_A25380 [Bryobacterales bacterium F-183]|nr:hypothetical protein F183_A25380 [Bryobacterales bacterium F-183]